MRDLREELEQMKFDLDIIQKEYCKEDEVKELKKMLKNKIPIPKDVINPEMDTYYRYKISDFSEDEKKEYFMYKQIIYLRSIKNGIIFFVVLAVISLFLSLISNFS